MAYFLSCHEDFLSAVLRSILDVVHNVVDVLLMTKEKERVRKRNENHRDNDGERSGVWISTSLRVVAARITFPGAVCGKQNKLDLSRVSLWEILGGCLL